MLRELIGVSISTVIACLYTYYLGTDTVKVDGIPSFWILVTIIHIIQIVAFVPAMIFQTEKFYDLVGGLSFVAASVVCIVFKPFLTVKENIAIIMMNLWATRMALFLFYRVMKTGGDSRFKKIKINAPKFFMAWFIQALWITLTSGPVCLMVINTGKEGDFGLKEILGVAIYAIGFIIQALADQQKLNFKLDPKNQHKFITTGLWSYSRHPNYVGDILLWAGISLYCLDSLHGYEKYASLICPVFTWLLLSKLSGVNLLEAKGDRTWGGQPLYEEYKRKTPVLFPGLGVGSNVPTDMSKIAKKSSQ